jgi:hypothetical protein
VKPPRVTLNGVEGRNRRVREPLEPEVARAAFVSGTVLIVGLALWPILSDWRWALGGTALFLIGLLYAAATGATKSDPNR